MRKAFNYAVPDVRRYIKSLAKEVLGYGFDGLELDFMSHPFLFRSGEERKFTDKLTDFVKDLKCVVDGSVGPEAKLMVRVPSTVDRCLRIGIEIERWIREEIVDMISIGRCYTPFTIPTEE